MINPADVNLIIFDCDGVLVDTEALANGVLFRHLRAKGVGHSLAETTQLFLGLSYTDIQARAQQYYNLTLDDTFWRLVQQETFTAFKLNLKPDPATLNLLRKLKKPYCVASSGSHEKMALSLGLTGLLPAFKNCLFSAEQVTRGKPAPDLFLYAADYFSVDPAHCLVIEDSLIGCEAAKAAGMQLLAFKIEASALYPDVITDLGALQHILG